MGVVVVALSLGTRLNAIKLKYVSALRIVHVPSVVTLLCKQKCNKALEREKKKNIYICKSKINLTSPLSVSLG